MESLPKCSFRLRTEWSKDYQGLLEAIGGTISLSSVRHLDLSRGRLGVLTVGYEADWQKLLDKGFHYEGVHVSVGPFDVDAVSVLITGC